MELCFRYCQSTHTYYSGMHAFSALLGVHARHRNTTKSITHSNTYQYIIMRAPERQSVEPTHVPQVHVYNLHTVLQFCVSSATGMGMFIITTMQEEEDPSCIALVYVHLNCTTMCAW